MAVRTIQLEVLSAVCSPQGDSGVQKKQQQVTVDRLELLLQRIQSVTNIVKINLVSKLFQTVGHPGWLDCKTRFLSPPDFLPTNSVIESTATANWKNEY